MGQFVHEHDKCHRFDWHAEQARYDADRDPVEPYLGDPEAVCSQNIFPTIDDALDRIKFVERREQLLSRFCDLGERRRGCHAYTIAQNDFGLLAMCCEQFRSPNGRLDIRPMEDQPLPLGERLQRLGQRTRQPVHDAYRHRLRFGAD